MLRLFAGFDQAHGTYSTEERSATSPKTEIKKTARTLREPVTEELWKLHLSGDRPLGIIPIRADSTCMWGAVDIDNYTIDHGKLVSRLEELGVPAMVARTKSGGAHIYVFFTEGIPAADVMSKLRELAARLGHGGCEVFPKQEQVLVEKGDLGNWLNMPYLAGDGGKRYAVTKDNRGISLARFLEVAEKRKISPVEFAALLPATRNVREQPTTANVFAEGPPCLEILTSEGFPDGTRNNGLMALGVLAKKVYPDGWQKHLEEWNRLYMQPPLSADEVKQVIRGLERKDYNYRCKDAPIVSYCDSRRCRMRRFGVGAQDVLQLVESIQILETDEPLFFVTVSVGGTVECDSKTLLNSRLFQEAVLTQLKKVVPLYKNDDWMPQIHRAVEDATRIDAPKDASTSGEFEEYLEQFLIDRHTSVVKEDMLLGRPWHDEENGRLWFRLQDLTMHLNRNKFSAYTRTQITARIRQMGGEGKFFNLKGRGTNAWSIPAIRINKLQEEHSPPKADESPI